MATIAELMVRVGADIGGFETGMSRVGSAVSSTAKAIGVGIAAAGASILALGKIGLDYNSQMEDFTTNFKVMLGSQEDAVAKVDELKKMAASTPFAMEDLADGTQTLLAFGVASEDSTGILKMLGDVSLGNAERFSALTNAFGKAEAAGKLTGETYQQMITQGFNPLNIIADKTGESMEELQKRMSAGGISADELTSAFESATSAGGQFYNGMEEASKTMSGQISTLKDNVMSLIGEAFQPVSDEFVNNILPTINAAIQNIDLSFIADSFNWLIDNAGTIVSAAAAITAGMIAWNVVTTVQAVIGAIKAWQVATEGMSTAQALLNVVMAANPIGIIITAIAALVAGLIVLWNTNEDFRNKVQAIWSSITETFTSAVSTISNFFTVTIPNAIKSALTWFDSLPGEFADIGKNIVTGLWSGISSGWDWLTEKVQNLANSLIKSVKSVLKISSPSRVFSGIGKFMAQGLGIGFESEMGNVTKTIQNSIPTSAVNIGVSGGSGMSSISDGSVSSGTVNNYFSINFTGNVSDREDVDKFGERLVSYLSRKGVLASA